MLKIGISMFAVAALAMLPFLAPVTTAQDGVTVVASGLNNPRSLVVTASGDVYVAEAGWGGDTTVDWVPPFGFATVGHSGRILGFSGGETAEVLTGIQSVALAGEEVIGVQGLTMVGGWIYATVGQMDVLSDGANAGSWLIRVDGEGNWEPVADLGDYERGVDPDTLGVDSNPFDVAAGPDGNLYVVDSGGNSLLQVTPTGHVSTVAAWPDNSVPTGVAFDNQGNTYVSFLSHFPFTPGTARVERWSNGSGVVVASGLTMVTDVAVGPDGGIYVVEIATEFAPNSGRILRLGSDGPQVVWDGLNYPSKIAFGDDGSLYVTNNSIGAPGSGQVLMVEMDSEG